MLSSYSHKTIIQDDTVQKSLKLQILACTNYTHMKQNYERNYDDDKHKEDQ